MHGPLGNTQINNQTVAGVNGIGEMCAEGGAQGEPGIGEQLDLTHTL